MACANCHKTTYIPYKNEYGKIVPAENLRKRNWKNRKRTQRERILTAMTRDVRFDEISVFAISFSVLMLLVFSPLMRLQVCEQAVTFWNELGIDSFKRFLFQFLYHSILIIIFLVPGLLGLIISIYHVFTDRPKNSFEKYCMFVTAVSVTLLAGGTSGYYLILNAFMSPWWWIWIIAPIWNGMNLFWFLGKLGTQIEDKNETADDIIIDNDTGLIETVVAAVVIALMVIMGEFLFKLHWSLTYSMCTIYATNFCKSWNEIFNPQEESDPIGITQ
jgi:hypothetical protein